MSLNLLEIVANPLDDPAIRFIERAAGPRLPTYGFEPEAISAIQMPGPLRRLYEYAGRWPDLYGQNRLLNPQELRLDGDKLIFFDENQHAEEWATEPQGNDATVWFREPGWHSTLVPSQPDGPWQKEAAPLSFFLFETLLCEYMIDWSPAGAYAQPAPTEELERVLGPFTPLPFGLFGPWPMRFFVTDEIAVQVDPNGFTWMGASSPDAIRSLGLNPTIWDVYPSDEPWDRGASRVCR